MKRMVLEGYSHLTDQPSEFLPHNLTLKARLPLANAPVGSSTGWPWKAELRVVGSKELFQENSAKE